MSASNFKYRIGEDNNNIQSLVSKWDDEAEKIIQRQQSNPFSDRYTGTPKWIKGTAEYAQPVGLTAERGQKAQKLINEEMNTLCYVIKSMGKESACGRIQVTFRELFETYTRISSKLVGILLRARKHNLVDFVGEMLWQRRDDHVIITLL